MHSPRCCSLVHPVIRHGILKIKFLFFSSEFDLWPLVDLLTICVLQLLDARQIECAFAFWTFPVGAHNQLSHF